MRPLRYSINVTLDGRCDHRVFWRMKTASPRGRESRSSRRPSFRPGDLRGDGARVAAVPAGRRDAGMDGAVRPNDQRPRSTWFRALKHADPDGSRHPGRQRSLTRRGRRSWVRARRGSCAVDQSLIASMPSRLSSSRWFRMSRSASGECPSQSKTSPITRSGCRVR